MEIVETDGADPFGVFALNLAGLNYALTPERLAAIRRLDPRPFPFFAVHAIVDGCVAGQVAVYRLPVVTPDGPAEVGGICAVCTHPAFSGRGIATRLLEEAHGRMRAAGLRLSTLGTNRHRVAHALYRRLGYVEVWAGAATLGRRELARDAAGLGAALASEVDLALADALFAEAAAGRLGFARRHPGFFAMLVATGELGAGELWLLRRGGDLQGYALAGLAEGVLRVKHLLMLDSTEAPAAIAALAAALPAPYLAVRVDEPTVGAALARAGWPPALPDWNSFLVKPLDPALSDEDARRLLGADSERFLISPLDQT